MKSESEMNIERELEKYLYNDISEIQKGQIVKCRIVDIIGENAIVDLGFKIEGKIKTSEIDKEKLYPGETIEAQVVSRGGQGLFILSYKAAKEKRLNDYLSKLYEEGKSVHGIVIGKSKGGFEVDVGELSGLDFGRYVLFCPFSEAEDIKVGSHYEFAIKKSDRGDRYILSRKTYLQVIREEERKKVLSTLKVGAIMEGKVIKVSNLFAEIDFGGGVRGRILRDDIDWNRVESCKDRLKNGQVVKVKIMEIDPDIRCSIKHIYDNPWYRAKEIFKAGDVVEGEISDVKDFGVFVKLKVGESEVEALLPFSEASWDRGEDIKNKFQVGQTISAAVINVSPEERKITLSMKKVLPNPYESLRTFQDKVRKAVVRSVSRKGYIVDVEVEEAQAKVRAFLPKSEISWFIDSENLKEGDEIEVKVLSVRKDDVIVSKKKVNEELLKNILDELVGKTVKARIVQNIDRATKGVWVVFEKDGKFLRGFVPVNELVSKISGYSKDEEIKCEVLDYSKNIDAFVLSENKVMLKEVKGQSQGVSLGAIFSQLQKK